MRLGEMFDVLFLGTGASIPSRERSLPCIAVRQGRSISLFDCGEGSQRQLMISPLSFMKVDRIFITHLHGDHVLGLPGLLQTMGMSGRKNKVSIFGPRGIANTLSCLLGACEGELEYETEVTELEGGETVDFAEFSVTAFATVHGTASLGFLYKEHDRPGAFDKEKAVRLGIAPGEDFNRLQRGEEVNGVRPEQVIGAPRPGCSLVYTGDTVPCPAVSENAKGVNILIHEATYIDEDSGLASEYMHSTAKAAAEVARECEVDMLALVHISNRYNDSEIPLAEARMVFENTVVPSDMQMFTILCGEIRSV